MGNGQFILLNRRKPGQRIENETYIYIKPSIGQTKEQIGYEVTHAQARVIWIRRKRYRLGKPGNYTNNSTIPEDEREGAQINDTTRIKTRA